MGFTTDFIGHIDIAPTLNADEMAYLSAFATSRRFDREGGPYDVPGNPYADDHEGVPTRRYNTPAPGQPQLWCQWVPCWDGCCLAYDGHEKFYAPIEWMRYLIAHFLKPGAAASRSGLSQFDAFTFDHRLDGRIVGCRRDNKELFSITVSNNRVRTTVLRPADPRYLDWPPLAYEEEIDRERAERDRRRSPRRSDGPKVVDLSNRR